MRVRFPAGGVGPGEGGASFRADLGRGRSSLSLSYRDRFSDGFDWSLGGKLPGFVDDLPIDSVVHTSFRSTELGSDSLIAKGSMPFRTDRDWITPPHQSGNA